MGHIVACVLVISAFLALPFFMLPHPTPRCAPGYEQACEARDHGARPVQPYGGR